APVRLTLENGLADVLDALRTERVGGAREPQLREGPVLALHERRRGPLRVLHAVGQPAIQRLEGVPDDLGRSLEGQARQDAGTEVTAEAPRLSGTGRLRRAGRLG